MQKAASRQHLHLGSRGNNYGCGFEGEDALRLSYAVKSKQRLSENNISASKRIFSQMECACRGGLWERPMSKKIKICRHRAVSEPFPQSDLDLDLDLDLYILCPQIGGGGGQTSDFVVPLTKIHGCWSRDIWASPLPQHIAFPGFGKGESDVPGFEFWMLAWINVHHVDKAHCCDTSRSLHL